MKYPSQSKRKKKVLTQQRISSKNLEVSLLNLTRYVTFSASDRENKLIPFSPDM